ncbi:ComEC/Rec2 family competence protein [Chitinophaga pollutisoli]|uniref:ComEC/Rec2 family competence protein n=1 Tax=Chitinophaga pollutisoli TaxID=3133966 RepID=A0ABZ2YIG3_9BACT
MKNQTWKAAPFLRLLPFLAAGAFAGTYFPLMPWMLMTICLPCWLLPAVLPLRARFAVRHVQGAGVSGMIFCVGMMMPAVTDIRRSPQWVGHLGGDSLNMVLVLTEDPQPRSRSWKAECRIESVGKAGEMRSAKGNIIVYFASDPGIAAGKRIFARARAEPIRNAGNPGAYDYTAYCERKGLFHRAFLSDAQWQRLPGNGFSVMEQWLHNAHAYTLRTLQRHIPGKERAGIAEALLVGYRAHLDAEVVRDYTNTGVVHIIAISGLHLGLIYLGGVQLLRWLPNRRWPNVLRALLLVGVLWFFSLLTGASASVLRSAVMFTAIAAGSFLISRHVSSHNNLAAAAFLLLAANPRFLGDAGFQLSFFAVAGIQICYRPLYCCWAPPWSWLDKIWQLAAVSLAAQAFTLPVCLYYFRQFPVYFLPANLVAVPWSTLLLYGELLLMAVSWWDAGAEWVGWALGWGIEGMNIVIAWLGDLPGAVWSHIRITLAETCVLYGVIVAAVAAGLLKSRRWFLGMGVLMAAWSAMHAFEKIKSSAQRRFVILNVPKATVVGYVEGRDSFWYGDSTVPSVNALQGAEWYWNLRSFSLTPPRRLMCLGGKRLLILDSKLPAKPPPVKIKIDYILLSHKANVNISRLEEYFTYELLIFDASLPPFRLQEWKNACNELTLRNFSVPDEGALVVNL